MPNTLTGDVVNPGAGESAPHMPCLNCRHDLYGLPLDSRCSECGSDVRASLVTTRLFFAPASYVRALAVLTYLWLFIFFAPILGGIVFHYLLRFGQAYTPPPAWLNESWIVVSFLWALALGVLGVLRVNRWYAFVALILIIACRFLSVMAMLTFVWDIYGIDSVLLLVKVSAPFAFYLEPAADALSWAVVLMILGAERSKLLFRVIVISVILSILYGLASANLDYIASFSPILLLLGLGKIATQCLALILLLKIIHGVLRARKEPC